MTFCIIDDVFSSVYNICILMIKSVHEDSDIALMSMNVQIMTYLLENYCLTLNHYKTKTEAMCRLFLTNYANMLKSRRGM